MLIAGDMHINEKSARRVQNDETYKNKIDSWPEKSKKPLERDKIRQ